jgi:hypothetical protein
MVSRAVVQLALKAAGAIAVALLALRPVAAHAQAREKEAPAAAGSFDAAIRDGNEAMLAMRYSDALEAYRRAAAASPDDVGVHYSLARAYQFLGLYPEALSELETFSARATPAEKARIRGLAELRGELEPRVARLDLRCNVAGARVLVRDRFVGVTPLRGVRLPAGASTVRLDLDGFFPETRDVVLPAGGALNLQIDLQPKRTSALLRVETTPLGSQIWIDGKLRGTTTPQVEVTLPGGPHEVLARKEGHDDATVPLVLAPGSTRKVTIPLEQEVPITARWWFWTGIGAVVAGGVTTAILLSVEREPSRGSLDPGRVAAP